MNKEFSDGFDRGAATHERHAECPGVGYMSDAFLAFIIKQNLELLEHLKVCPKTTAEELEFFKQIETGFLEEQKARDKETPK